MLILRVGRLARLGKMQENMQTSDAKGGKMDGGMKGIRHSVMRYAAFAKCFPAINSDRYLSLS